LIRNNGAKLTDRTLESQEDLIIGIVYAKFGELGPKTQSYFPLNLSYNFVTELLMRSTCFISADLSKMNEKISIFPFPEYNLLGFTYFFQESAGAPEKYTNAAVTLLINDKLSNFINQNTDNLKQNLKELSISLENSKSRLLPILSEYFSSLIDTISRYDSIKILEKGVGPRINGKSAVLLSYFHVKKGPMPLFSHPVNVFSEEQLKRISNKLDINVERGFFTCTFTDLVAMNFYFEINSPIARSNTEMCLISLLFDIMPSNKVLNNISFNLSKRLEKLISQPDIYLAFYKFGYDYPENKERINEMHAYLRQWVIETYQACLENNS
jgi:hypothetical protein